jgi:hypothetical protein
LFKRFFAWAFGWIGAAIDSAINDDQSFNPTTDCGLVGCMDERHDSYTGPRAADGVPYCADKRERCGLEFKHSHMLEGGENAIELEPEDFFALFNAPGALTANGVVPAPFVPDAKEKAKAERASIKPRKKSTRKRAPAAAPAKKKPAETCRSALRPSRSAKRSQ